MKKETVLFLIVIVVILGSVLPKPINTVASLIILVPVVIYLIADVIRNGNTWEK